MITVSDLRTIRFLADQSEENLEWMASVCKEELHPDGGIIVHRGDAAEKMLLVLEGAIQFFLFERGQRFLFNTWPAGEITGLLPFSRMKELPGDGYAFQDVRLAVLYKEHFGELVSRMPDLTTSLVGYMTDRVRETTRTNAQNDRMFALGKLSAGLAHELNNPAAAIKRAVSDLSERIDQLPELVGRIVGHGLTGDQLTKARDELKACVASTPGTVSALERSDREGELGDWLADHGVEQPYSVAEFLAEEGITPAALEGLSMHVPDPALADVVVWIEKGLGARRLIGEVERSSTRISELVASVKLYSHMDQTAERQPVDVHEGIESTLTMLGHEIKAGGITVKRNYTEGLAAVFASPGELNQVWTNLIDNAIYAAGKGGRTIEIATRHLGQLVCVSITDDGQGIPSDVQGRIFDPFFSTKPPGEGTGLGLDIVNRIVRQQEGKISVESEPGRTTFEVCIPIVQEATS